MIKQNKVVTGPKFLRRDFTVEPSISSEVWATIDAAFRERIEAVELFMADVAGRFRFRPSLNLDSWVVGRIEAERELLTSQLPNFQRRISLAAADLACDSTGQFWFVDDHYSCPMGLYKYSSQLAKTENPSSISEFARFTQHAQEAIRKHHTGDNSAVVLGSSTFNTVYREHRFIADFLNLPYATRQRLSVDGNGDLICVNGAMSYRVQTVVRRLQDEDLDSSCYRVDSLQGVRGLVRAAQRGQVRLLNAAGTGLFNHRSICALIPRMIRFYLGKDPILPTVPTIPVFEPEFAKACAGFRNYVFRTDNAMDVRKPVVGQTGSESQLAGYMSQIAETPNEFVARSTVKHASGSSADALYSMRIFCAGTSRRLVLRGGLKRACREDGTPVSSIAKDQTAVCAAVETQMPARL